MYENLKSTVLIPTKKCCGLMCANFSKPSEKSSADTPPSEKPKTKVVIQQENVNQPHHIIRRMTGWTPAHRMTVAEAEAAEKDDDSEDEDEDDDKPNSAKKSSDKTDFDDKRNSAKKCSDKTDYDDKPNSAKKSSDKTDFDDKPNSAKKSSDKTDFDDKPNSAKRSSDKTVLYLTQKNANPLKISANTAKSDKDTEVNKLSTLWSKKDPLVYSTVAVRDNKSSRYWVKSELQYLFLIPTRRSIPQVKESTNEEFSNIPSRDERTSTRSFPSKQQTGSSLKFSNPPSWDDKITRRSTAFYEQSLRRTQNEENEEEEDIYGLKEAKDKSPPFDYGDDDDDDDSDEEPVKKVVKKKKRGFWCFKRKDSSSS